MAVISEFVSNSINYLLTVRFSDIVDILIVAFLIYEALGLIIKTNSARVARGIIFVIVALWLSGLLNLTMVNTILRKTVELGLIAIVIIFQPELRRVLERVGSSKITTFFKMNRSRSQLTRHYADRFGVFGHV
jgi:diadenylate cyclase